MEQKLKSITSRDVDFAKWYTDVVAAAHLADYSNTKGSIIFEPNGYAIWENMQKILDQKFKELGHQNVYMPLLIPENLLLKEKEHVEGFAPEVAWVTQGGDNNLDEKLCIRPTSETLFCDYYSKVVRSYRDLPKLYNQWCNVVRWEKETRPFLRTREFLWQEGHTIHETKEEAIKETYQMLEVYKDFFENYLAIPVITGKKTEKEKFAGADMTLTLESLMYNGISLQSATSHYFGQNFTKPFDIKFTNRNNELEYAYQTSWGTTTRMIGALIMVHGDDRGLVLPPRIAPKQVVIINVKNTKEVEEMSKKIYDKLLENNISCYIDNSDKSFGFKISESEVNGIPVRIEIGPRDLENNNITISRRDTLEKYIISINEDIIKYINELMGKIQSNMFLSAKKRNEEKTYKCTSLDEVKDIYSKGYGFIKAMWCGDPKCEAEFKNINGIKSRCIPFTEEVISDKCICCGRDAKHMVIWGKQY
ncbi:MAG: proline--tRNA ligase [Clostridium sp.]|nr:proline--tRNA ligase [Clostridium sp.]MCM1444047.1 proline--tRNA ligase [Candidatus Amulumruptor caecigallinarius]